MERPVDLSNLDLDVTMQHVERRQEEWEAIEQLADAVEALTVASALPGLPGAAGGQRDGTA